ncbi:MAG: nitrilase family protein [Flavobacteriaceae bacterium]|nr:nitrilase family protein [Flavobacteriaceae bacterium]
MENLLKTAIIQSNLVWENPKQNRINFSYKIDAISNDVDLIVLQEMFSTAYTINASAVAEKMTGDTVNWMLEKAKEKNALLIGSIIIEEPSTDKTKNKNYFNRLIAAFPNGKIQHYDKRHLFSFAQEDKIFTSGKNRTVILYKGWKLLPLICYDLRFPVWARNTEEFDVLIYVANWPNTRISAWDILLKARAIENLCYVVGTNRLGKDKNGLEYIGHSAVIDVMGKLILEFDKNQEATKTVILNKKHILDSRNKFSFLNDRDQFKIID